MAQRAFTTHPLVVRRVEVRRIAEVTARMRRITVGGEQLGSFPSQTWQHPAFVSPGFDDHLKLIFASDGDAEAAAPTQLEHGIEWGPSPTRQARDYTPRAVRAVGDDVEIDLDFVMHGEGPAASWAARATAGDDLWFVGPKSSTRLPAGLTRIVLVGDETALPAIGRFFDERPADVPASVAVVVGDDSARQELRVRPGDTVEWIVGDAADADVVDRAVRRVCGDDGEGLYAWVAGESRALLPVRRFLTRELGLAKTHINVTGYWHAEVVGEEGQSAPESADAAVPRAGAGSAAPAVLPVPSPLPWFVMRAGLQLGLVDAVADAPGIASRALADRCGVSLDQLDLLLPVLRAHGAITGDPSQLRLGEFGEELLDDEHARERFDGYDAEVLLTLAELAPAMRAGAAPWVQRHGITVRGRSSDDEDAYEELLEGAESLAFLLDGLVADPVWGDAARVLLTGPGSALVAGAVADSGRLPQIEVSESVTGISVLRAQLDEQHAVSWSMLPAGDLWGGETEPVDLVVGALALAHRTDEEAASLLRLLALRARKAIIVESSRPDGLSPFADEDALHSFAVTGAPLRDSEAIAALGASAGWRLDRVVSLGWGVEATHLRR